MGQVAVASGQASTGLPLPAPAERAQASEAKTSAASTPAATPEPPPQPTALVPVSQTPGTREAVPTGLLFDNVHFTMTGPGVLAPGTAHELQFWLHVEEQRSTVLAAASALHGLPQSEVAVKSEGPYPLPRGSHVSVRLKINGLKC